MKRNTLFSFLTIAALGLLTAGPAYAGTFTWKATPEDNVFQNENNWTSSGFRADVYPTAGDTVTIQATTNDKDPEISHNEIFATLTIDNSGELTVTGANTLTLTGSSHTLNGNLVLQDDDSMVKCTSATVTLNGSSTTGIKGENNGAELQIDDSTLTSNALIQGHMIIMESSGNSTFVNGSTGVVLANADGGGSDAILLLAAGLTLSNCSTAIWEASNDSDAVLQFDEDATLTGLFRLDDCANIVIAANTIVSTTNTLKDKNGTATAEGYVKTTSGTDSMFRYKTACDTGNFIDVSDVCKLFGTECSACP